MLVSVLAYNAPTQTRETLRCLSRQAYSNYRLQLIDNASTIDYLDDVRREFPEIAVRRLPANLGYTGGSNVALAQGLNEGYDYVLLCTHDVEVVEQALAWLVQTAETCPASGIVGGIEVQPSTRRPRAHAGAAYSKWTGRSPWTSTGGTESNSQATFCVHGALVLISSRALQARVRFDERLFMYYDEVDLGFQLRNLGLVAYVDQRVRFIHHRSVDDHAPRVGYLMQRNRTYMVRKHGSWYHQWFYYPYALFELSLKWCVMSLRGRRGYAAACLRGHCDALRGRFGPPERVGE